MSGYELADGTLSTDYKIGDKFVVVEPKCGLKVGDIVSYYYDDGSELPQFKTVLGRSDYNNCDGENGGFLCWSWLKKLPTKSTKSDLKDGMRVVYRDGTKRLVLHKDLYMENTAGDYEWVVSLSVFNDDLVWESNPICDIMKVVDRDGTVLFEREETPVKSQQEIEMEKLQKQIDELQAQVVKLIKQPWGVYERFYRLSSTL